MAVTFGIVGAGLIALVLVDMLRTTVVVGGGGGPLTRRMARSLWRAALRRHARRPSRRALVRWSYGILGSLVVFWVLASWVGWSLVFMAGEHAVLDAQTSAPADAWSRAYFAGFSLITLGVGDYRPGAPPWQVLTVLAAVNGFVVVTLTITYLAPVLGAKVEMRALAATIVDLGPTPTSLLLQAWNEGDLSGLDATFTSLAAAIRTHEQRHQAYPVLHFTVSEERRTSDAVAIAVLDEALTLVEHAVRREHRPTSLAWRSVRRAVDALLVTRATSGGAGNLDAPPTPPLGALRAGGIPLLGDDDVERSMASVAERRRRLAILVRDAGWSWDAVHAALDHETGGARD